MDILAPVKEWVFKIALKKAIVSLSKLAVSFFAGKGIIFVGTLFGYTIDTGNQATIELFLTGIINSGLTILRNWLKVKFPGKFGWL